MTEVWNPDALSSMTLNEVVALVESEEIPVNVVVSLVKSKMWDLLHATSKDEANALWAFLNGLTNTLLSVFDSHSEHDAIDALRGESIKVKAKYDAIMALVKINNRVARESHCDWFTIEHLWLSLEECRERSEEALQLVDDVPTDDGFYEDTIDYEEQLFINHVYPNAFDRIRARAPNNIIEI